MRFAPTLSGPVSYAPPAHSKGMIGDRDTGEKSIFGVGKGDGG